MREEGFRKLWARLKKVEDLIEFEGPLLSLFSDPKDGNLYLVSWMDVDKWTNEWLVFNTTAKSVMGFKEGKKTLKQCIKEASTLFFINVDNDLILVNIRETTFDQIPADKMPDDDSFIN